MKDNPRLVRADRPPPLPPERDPVAGGNQCGDAGEPLWLCLARGVTIGVSAATWLALCGFAWVLMGGWISEACAAEPPARAMQYQRDLTREARAVWGLNAPVAVMAAQVHQESAWRRDAESPYAQGLAQFTPDTAEWMAELYPVLDPVDVWHPQWALRALVRYDRLLWERYATPAATACDRWAFTLSSYNGGAGWVQRDRRQCRASQRCPACDPARWWGHVEDTPDPRRADWAVHENRGYPRRILLMLQPRYTRWGPGVACPH